MKVLNIIAQVLIVVGGLNWGLVGLFQIDLVAALLGGESAVWSRVVYSIIGIAALYGLYLLRPVSEDRRAVDSPTM